MVCAFCHIAAPTCGRDSSFRVGTIDGTQVCVYGFLDSIFVRFGSLIHGCAVCIHAETRGRVQDSATAIVAFEPRCILDNTRYCKFPRRTHTLNTSHFSF